MKDKIRAEFKKHGVTDADLVKDFNMKQPNANAIINGTRKVGAKRAKEFADKYGVDSNILLYGESSEKENNVVNFLDTTSELIYQLKDRLKEKDERLSDKDKIIARTEESLELWKEKAKEYEKKISTNTSAYGTTIPSQPKIGREKK